MRRRLCYRVDCLMETVVRLNTGQNSSAVSINPFQRKQTCCLDITSDTKFFIQSPDKNKEQPTTVNYMRYGKTYTAHITVILKGVKLNLKTNVVSPMLQLLQVVIMTPQLLVESDEKMVCMLEKPLDNKDEGSRVT